MDRNCTPSLQYQKAKKGRNCGGGGNRRAWNILEEPHYQAAKVKASAKFLKKVIQRPEELLD